MSGTSQAVLTADAVVIGSGAGGGPVAAVLAEAGLDVLVLESGSRFSAADFNGKEGELFLRLGRLGATDDGSFSLYAGHCVGGSTVVNDALCWHPPPEILAGWARDHDLTGLDEAALAPYVERVWRDIHASPTTREYLNRNAYRLELGAARLGWSGEAMPRNVWGCAKLGLCNFGCPANAKQSTLLTYVPRAERSGARVLANARVSEIVAEAGSVRGVRGVRLDADGNIGDAFQVSAPVVCVAAGVMETGALLLRSGLSGADESAGRGLQFHSSVHVTARFREPVHGYFGPTMAYAVTEFADVHGHDGPGFMIENTTVHPVIVAQNLPRFGVEHQRAMEALPFLARSAVVLRDRTRGRVTVDGDGRAHFDYALHEDDLVRIRDAMIATARAYLAADALEVFLPLDGVPSVRSEADLRAVSEIVPRQGDLFSLYAVHLFGGAAMAGSAHKGFCDVEGRAFDVDGLFVCDASSLPGNTGANPQVTIMANALRIAEGIAS